MNALYELRRRSLHWTWTLIFEGELIYQILYMN